MTNARVGFVTQFLLHVMLCRAVVITEYDLRKGLLMGPTIVYNVSKHMQKGSIVSITDTLWTSISCLGKCLIIVYIIKIVLAFSKRTRTKFDYSKFNNIAIRNSSSHKNTFLDIFFTTEIYFKYNLFILIDTILSIIYLFK